MKISASILNSKDRIYEIERLNKTDIDYLHIDLMDGIFVEPTEFSVKEIINLNNHSNKKLDIHMMVDNPLEYVDNFKNLNVEYITFHLETKYDILEIINRIKNLKFKVGISIKPNTDINNLLPYLEYIDMILVMSVEPGYGGQKFMLDTLDRVKMLKEMLKEKKLNILIEVDGGINDIYYKELKNNGCDIVVLGTYLTNSENILEQLHKLK